MESLVLGECGLLWAIAARTTRYIQKNNRSAIAPTSPPLQLPQQPEPASQTQQEEQI